MTLPTKHVKLKLNKKTKLISMVITSLTRSLGTRTPTMQSFNKYTFRGGRRLFPTSRIELEMGRKWKALALEAPQPKMLAPSKNHGVPDSKSRVEGESLVGC